MDGWVIPRVVVRTHILPFLCGKLNYEMIVSQLRGLLSALISSLRHTGGVRPALRRITLTLGAPTLCLLSHTPEFRFHFWAFVAILVRMR